MRIALAQINTVIGDFAGNLTQIRHAIEAARSQGADLVLFPELALCGYPPLDLIERTSFVRANEKALEEVLPRTHGLAVVLGLVTAAGADHARPGRNTAAFIADGDIIALRHKTLLPSYDVFDEDRYFVPAETNEPVTYRGTRFGISICEDLWNDRGFWARSRYPVDPVERLVEQGAQVLLNLSASPFHVGKAGLRRDIVAAAAARHRRFVFLTNLVGGNDELIFDGSSLGVGPDGAPVCQAASFREELLCCDFDPDDHSPASGQRHALPTTRAREVLEALELGLRDYVFKCGFRKVVLGLSGGIDSALTAAIATRALGPDNVMGVAMPSRYSSQGSVDDARALAEGLGISFQVISIEPLFKASLEALEPVFAGLPQDLTEENLQARARGVVLMALANKFGRLLLNTGNKSEAAVGYSTLYGDMCGGLAVIADLPKGLVYEVAREINALAGYNVIPESTLTKAPSAELRPDQKDQDSLPPYAVLDAILEAYVEDCKTIEDIMAMGYEREVVVSVTRMIDRSEYKRRQAPPGLRVTSKAFGMGRRLPLAQRFRET